MKNETRLTSVKINIEVQNKFKHVCLENGMNFQKLVNRCLVLYLAKKEKNSIIVRRFKAPLWSWNNVKRNCHGIFTYI